MLAIKLVLSATLTVVPVPLLVLRERARLVISLLKLQDAQSALREPQRALEMSSRVLHAVWVHMQLRLVCPHARLVIVLLKVVAEYLLVSAESVITLQAVMAWPVKNALLVPAKFKAMKCHARHALTPHMLQEQDKPDAPLVMCMQLVAGV